MQDKDIKPDINCPDTEFLYSPSNKYNDVDDFWEEDDGEYYLNIREEEVHLLI